MGSFLSWLADHDESLAIVAAGVVLVWSYAQIRKLQPIIKWFDPTSDLSDANDGTIPGRVHDLERRVAKLERDPE